MSLVFLLSTLHGVLCAQAQGDMHRYIYHLEKAKEKNSLFNEPDSVYYYASRALEIARQLGHDSLVYEARNQLIYYYTTRKEKVAFEAVNQNYMLAQAMQDSFLIMRSCLDFATLYAPDGMQTNVDSFDHYLNQALQIALHPPDPVHIIVAIQHKIEARLLDNYSLDEIPALARLALQYENTDEETRSMCRMIHVGLGQYYIQKNQYSLGIAELKRFSSVASNDGDLGFTQYVLAHLAEAYAKAGNYKMAYHTRLQANTVGEQIFNAEKEKTIQQMQYTFETKEKEARIALLEQEKKLETEKAVRLRKNIIFLVLFLFVISFLFALAYTNYKRRRAADASLLALQEEVAEDKSRMITNVTHEFRTPLTVIQGMTGRITSHEEEKKLIQRNSAQLLDMVDQMLTLAKAESGLLEQSPIRSDIVQYAKYLNESFYLLLTSKEIDFQFHADPKQIIMDFDPDFIRYIYANLMSNAIKFTPQHGRIQIELQQRDQQLKWSFFNSGVGLTPDEEAHVFDRFYQGTQAANYRGSGIGLALVAELISVLQGSIRVEGKKDIGTCFYVSLPITHNASLHSTGNLGYVQHGIAQQPVVLAGNIQDADDKKTVLIVEDNRDVQAYIESCLIGKYQTQQAYDGKAGLEKAIATVPDIIILDVMMPQMDGHAVVRTLKANAATDHIPVVMLTAKASDASKVEGLQAGADVYLTKPFSEAVLLLQVENLLAQVNRIRQKYTASEIQEQEVIRTSPFLENLEVFLETHYQKNPLNADMVSQHLLMSRMQVHRKLKALTGLSLSKYVNAFRLRKAKEMLHDKNLNISDVAYQCGFSDPAYFSKLFAEQYAERPSVYRQRK